MDIARLKKHWEFHSIRQLPDGTVLGLYRFLFTWGLMVGVKEWDYERRYCYKDLEDALSDLETWDGTKAPPGPWIKEK